MLVAAAGSTVPKAKKTGTTICGVVYKDGVVLGADTRATEGSTVSGSCKMALRLSSFSPFARIHLLSIASSPRAAD